MPYSGLRPLRAGPQQARFLLALWSILTPGLAQLGYCYSICQLRMEFITEVKF